MKHFLNDMIPRFDARWLIARQHLLPVLSCVLLVNGFYIASRYIGPGWTTWACSTICIVLMALTAWARLNDIAADKTAFHWQLRRIGLVLVVGGCVGIVFSPWVNIRGQSIPDFPSWKEVMFRLGILLAWMTTPFMPPWYRYISGEHRNLVVEVPDDVMVDVVRTPTDSTGGMYTGSGPGKDKGQDT